MLEFVVYFVVSLGVLSAIREPARLSGLVDRPDGRKLHKSQVPLVGGLGIALTVLALQFVLPHQFSDQIQYILLFGYLILIVGVIDDRWPLSSILRLLLQTLIVLATIGLSGLYVESLDTILVPDVPLALGGFGVVFTVFCLTGVINASNMIDGIDGLLGVVFSITMFAIAALAVVDQVQDVAMLALGLLGTIAAFLMFNLGLFGKKRKIFLGDAGSTYIGFIVGFLLIALSELDPVAISTVSAGWLFGFPLMDSVSVILRRITQGRSALLANNDHFHHRLLQAGFTPLQVVIVVGCMHTLMVIIGVFANLVPIPGYVLFYSFVLLTVFFHLKNDSLIKFLQAIRSVHDESSKSRVSL